MALPTRHTADGTLLIALIMCSGDMADQFVRPRSVPSWAPVSALRAHVGRKARDDAGRIERLRKVSITGEFSLPIAVHCPSRLFSLLFQARKSSTPRLPSLPLRAVQNMFCLAVKCALRCSV